LDKSAAAFVVVDVVVVAECGANAAGGQNSEGLSRGSAVRFDSPAFGIVACSPEERSIVSEAAAAQDDVESFDLKAAVAAIEWPVCECV
jgi:hypothetical protein